ncbi:MULTISPECIES: hypothetical protein [unclassified Mesorhizobium]|uniref:hypothetical protein n=1 Tax=unclassified Mesorhizobium TaxID=325217 RepID=UPI000FD92F25|nr:MULTISPECIES: hypothetical protein [unclassified Mesorhizobium]TGR47388.1 hypothetical protein EN842_23880 [bacterium M00.F.Ca.ET.199.01.1.1]TGU36841.1 hypothetical protein EN799_14665 [bacterium M00.F.Ca.ET.156.01.1.1]TGV88029.1 hypothetical protein EN792_010910 [Mesorhizobium sp. M00.F.Ca.ET.149.01.1.1]TGR29101.1 hypothetical protein EN845_12160 [Mesorhizobium sp. M8A.F.Ca.ET.202.01.1.1]TGR29674.1 hypothetical protein EN840_08195 [Mesorhizobium sp. M8A.F.Ca.ET.197.01.1.1]
MDLIRKIKNIIYRFAIAIAQRTPAPDRIPLSPPNALGNNFHQVELFERHDPTKNLLVRALTKEGPQGIYFNGVGEAGFDAAIPNRFLSDYRIVIRHYLKGYELRTKSPSLFILQWLTGYAKMAIWADKTGQFFFNRKRLVRLDRMEVMDMFVRKTTTSLQYQTSAPKLLSELYSLRSFSHPQSLQTMNHYRLVLDSLKADGYLINEGADYRLSPTGLGGLTDFQIESQRFARAQWQQTILAILTVGLLLVGAAQVLVSFYAKG